MKTTKPPSTRVIFSRARLLRHAMPAEGRRGPPPLQGPPPRGPGVVLEGASAPEWPSAVVYRYIYTLVICWRLGKTTVSAENTSRNFLAMFSFLRRIFFTRAEWVFVFVCLMFVIKEMPRDRLNASRISYFVWLRCLKLCLVEIVNFLVLILYNVFFFLNKFVWFWLFFAIFSVGEYLNFVW